MKVSPGKIFKALYNLRKSLVFFLVFLATTLIYKNVNGSHVFLFEYTNFKSVFGVSSALLKIIFISFFISYCYILGHYIVNRLRMELPGTITLGIGIIAVNILLLPLFFLNLLYFPVLIALFLIISITASEELDSIISITRTLLQKTRRKHILIMIGIPACLHLINAILPVTFSESLGDIANSYFHLPMNFAYFHGIKFIPHLAATIVNYLNFEVIASALIVLSNPETVKLFGFVLFIATAFMIFDLSRNIFHDKLNVFAPFLFLTSIMFIFDGFFSFAHERVYFIYVSLLSFYLLFIGINKKQPRYHQLNFIVMGILAGIGLAGIISVFINLVILLVFYTDLRANSGKLLPFFVIFFLLAAIFPAWNYLNTGNIAPTNTFIYNLFNENPDIYNGYLIDRLQLQFSRPTMSFTDYLFYPFNFFLTLFNFWGVILFIFFLAGLIFLKDKKLRILYFYFCLSVIILSIICPPLNKGNGRFFMHTIPVLVVLIINVLLKLKSLFVKHYKKNVVDLAIVTILFSSLILQALNLEFIYFLSTFDISKFNINRIYINRLDRSSLGTIRLYLNKIYFNKLYFLANTINLKAYLGKNNIDKVEWLNKHFSAEDKILYLFHAQGIYSKPALYQPTKNGAASIIYRTEDKSVIMNKLKDMGIRYLCIDNKWGISPDKAWMSMVADITTPIFEPAFFSNHFMPQSTGIKDFYIFEIDYNGINNEDGVMENFANIFQTGFYEFVYASLKQKGHNIVRLKSNPYSPEQLLSKYRLFF